MSAVALFKWPLTFTSCLSQQGKTDHVFLFFFILLSVKTFGNGVMLPVDVRDSYGSDLLKDLRAEKRT